MCFGVYKAQRALAILDYGRKLLLESQNESAKTSAYIDDFMIQRERRNVNDEVINVFNSAIARQAEIDDFANRGFAYCPLDFVEYIEPFQVETVSSKIPSIASAAVYVEYSNTNSLLNSTAEILLKNIGSVLNE
jgi:hypothetical protein